MCNAYKVKKMMKFLYGEINLNVTKFRKRFFNATFKKKLAGSELSPPGSQNQTENEEEN